MEKTEQSCPCGSGRDYSQCCGPIHDGIAKAETAEQLMRARYCAYVMKKVPFLGESMGEASRAEFDAQAAAGWCDAAVWHRLEIVSTDKGGKDDSEGTVEFRAAYTAGGRFCDHHEKAVFARENGEWKFIDGEFVKDVPFKREKDRVGRNDPCPCGSGKKYKKCCGA
ncbi:MAG: YchJ family protein [Kiritimatiellae bacterium]|nr:YchJ family protein [Kiritimatiellia bacterium]